jgi:hypothetical protein
VVSHEFALAWMTDSDAFQQAARQGSTYLGSLVQSMSLVLEEFYANLRVRPSHTHRERKRKKQTDRERESMHMHACNQRERAHALARTYTLGWMVEAEGGGGEEGR